MKNETIFSDKSCILVFQINQRFSMFTGHKVTVDIMSNDLIADYSYKVINLNTFDLPKNIPVYAAQDLQIF